MEEVCRSQSGVLVARPGRERSPGTVLFPTVEGRRPLVVEIQALVVPTNADHAEALPSTVLPSSRVHQVIGVLERHAAMPLRLHEVYVNVMGGIKVTEPGADLPNRSRHRFVRTPMCHSGRTDRLGRARFDGRRPSGGKRSAVRRSRGGTNRSRSRSSTGDTGGTTRLFEVHHRMRLRGRHAVSRSSTEVHRLACWSDDAAAAPPPSSYFDGSLRARRCEPLPN